LTIGVWVDGTRLTPRVFGGSKGANMEIIKEALMHWGEAIHLNMENRTMFYSPVLDHWRVKKWGGKSAKGFIYDGGDFMTALEHLLGAHAAEHPPAPEN
jgi:hypothetical protein